MEVISSSETSVTTYKTTLATTQKTTVNIFTVRTSNPRMVCTFLISPMHASHTHLILLDLITPIIFGEKYKLWNSSL
jgi:hypothetical protein